MAWPGLTVFADCIKSIMNTILHQCIAIAMIYSLWGPALIGGQLSWHVVLCTLGIFPFMAEALILFGGENVWTTELEKDVKIWLHLIMMTFGVTFMVAGIAIEIERHRFGFHFNTAHGILGLIVLILIFLSIFIGVFARFSKTFKGYAKPAVILFTHNIVGILTYIFSIASLCTGYYTHFFTASDTSKIASIILCCCITVWSLIHSLTSLYKQARLIF